MTHRERTEKLVNALEQVSVSYRLRSNLIESAFLEVEAQALERAASIAEKWEGYWFDCDIPTWLGQEMGTITNEIKALKEPV